MEKESPVKVKFSWAEPWQSAVMMRSDGIIYEIVCSVLKETDSTLTVAAQCL